MWSLVSRQECHSIESGRLHQESCRSVHATRLPHSWDADGWKIWTTARGTLRNENNHERMLRSREHKRYQASELHGKGTRPQGGHAPTLQKITWPNGDWAGAPLRFLAQRFSTWTENNPPHNESQSYSNGTRGGYQQSQAQKYLWYHNLFWTSIFTSSESGRAASKPSVSTNFVPSDFLNTKPPTLLLLWLQYLQIQFLPLLMIGSNTNRGPGI